MATFVDYDCRHEGPCGRSGQPTSRRAPSRFGRWDTSMDVPAVGRRRPGRHRAVPPPDGRLLLAVDGARQWAAVPCA